MRETRRYCPAWLFAAGALFLADLFLHLPVTDFCDLLARRFGFPAYDRFTRNAFLGLGCVCFVAAWAWPGRRRIAVGISTSVLLAVAALAETLLIVAGVENIHFPQYALLAYVLANGLSSVDGAWIAASTLGLADEAYQRVALPRGTPTYFDWNDVVLNGIGATFAVVALVALAGARVERVRVPSRWMLALAVLGVLCAMVLSPPVFSPFFTLTPGGARFHKLAASEAAVVLAFLWTGVRYLVRQPAQGVREPAAGSVAQASSAASAASDAGLAPSPTGAAADSSPRSQEPAPYRPAR